MDEMNVERERESDGHHTESIVPFVSRAAESALVVNARNLHEYAVSGLFVCSYARAPRMCMKCTTNIDEIYWYYFDMKFDLCSLFRTASQLRTIVRGIARPCICVMRVCS